MNRSMARLTMLAMALALTPTATVRGVTPLPSADGQFWDIRDTSVWAQDSGGIEIGRAHV